jgi:hypothetical protein
MATPLSDSQWNSMASTAMAPRYIPFLRELDIVSIGQRWLLRSIGPICKEEDQRLNVKPVLLMLLTMRDLSRR